MPRRVLHLLSQRPHLTGSGVTLDALVHHASRAGWEQHVVVGVPADDPAPAVAGLPPGKVHPLVFERNPLDFAVPGMSDVMPYPSTCFAAMTSAQLEAYRSVWSEHLRSVIARVQPDIIHSHHVWILSSLVKDFAPGVPVVTQSHATGLRQMVLCPHLADEVRNGCRRNDRFLALHEAVAEQIQRELGVARDRIEVVGAGYREDLFHARGRVPVPGPTLLYVGKYAAAKGLPWLLDAFERLRAERPGLRLHVAGSGAGEEAEALRARMTRMSPAVVLHGQLAQPALADLMRSCAVCVLPSFYEGLPLVLVEARACGCQLVATRVGGVASELSPRLGDDLQLVAPPRLSGVDRPVEEDLPALVEALCGAIARALDRAASGRSSVPDLSYFTWAAVFRRVEAVWRSLLVS